MNTYSVQVTVSEALVSFQVCAKTPEEALAIGREMLKKKSLFAKDVEVTDSTEEVSGVY